MIHRKISHLLVALVFSLALLAAVIAPQAAAQDGGFPVTVTDETGFEITLESPAERVLCLSIACLDHLAALGLTPAGMTDLLTIPYEQHFGALDENITVIAGGMQPDLEQIVVMAPDLIVGQAGFFDPLRAPLADVAPLYLAFPNTVEETVQELLDLGALTGHADEADAIAAEFEAKLAAYRADAPGEATLMIVFGASEEDNMFLEAASGQTCDLLTDLAVCPFTLPEGASPMAAFGYENFSFEIILEANPDYIFFAGYNPNRTQADEVFERLEANPLWIALSAVENDHISGIDPWTWRAGRGLVLLEDTLDQAMTALYPDVFAEPLPPVFEPMGADAVLEDDMDADMDAEAAE